jgi:hypothetical protein
MLCSLNDEKHNKKAPWRQGVLFYILICLTPFFVLIFIPRQINAQDQPIDLLLLNKFFQRSPEQVSVSLDSMGYEEIVPDANGHVPINILYGNYGWRDKSGTQTTWAFCKSNAKVKCVGFVLEEKSRNIAGLDVYTGSQMDLDVAAIGYTTYDTLSESKIFVNKEKDCLILNPGSKPNETLISFNRRNSTIATSYLKKRKKK